MQKYPHIDPINGAAHDEWISLLEARGYVWAPLQEGHEGYVGPTVDMECEVIEVSEFKTLVLTFGKSAYLLGYQANSDIPTIFSCSAHSVELALQWVGALR